MTVDVNDRKRKGWTLFAIAASALMIYWTNGGLQISLPVIAQEFGVSASEASTVVMVYYLALGVLTLPFGRLGDSIGHDKVFQTGLAAGTVLSVISPFVSRSLGILVCMRILSGIALSMCLSVTQAILVTVFPPEERGKILGINSTLIAGSGMLGQFLGGIASDHGGWRLLFLLPVPVGIAGFLAGRKYLKGFSASRKRVDYTGAALIVVFLTCLTLILKKASSMGKGLLALTAVICIASLAVLILWERRAENPLLALQLFRLKGFSVGYVLMTGCYIVAAVIQTAIPFYLQQTKGVSTSVSGGIALIFTLTMVLLAPTFGSLSDRAGVRKIVLSGILVQAVFVFCYACLNEKTPLALTAVVLFLFGLGSAMFYSPNASAVMGSVPKDNIGMTSGMSSAVRSIATSIGQNVFSILIAWRTAAHAGEALSEGLLFRAAQHDTVLIMTVLLIALFVLGFLLMPGRRSRQGRSSGSISKK